MITPDEHGRIEELTRANPVSTEELRASLSDRDRENARRQAIARGSESGSEPDEPPSGSNGWFRRRGVRVRLGLALVIAAVVVTISFDGDSVRTGQQPAYAASVVRAAEESPRILVGLDGWSVNRADQFEANSGEVQFGNGRDQLRVIWEPAESYPRYDTAIGADGQWFKLPVACTTLADSGQAELDEECEFFSRTTGMELLGEQAQLQETLTASKKEGTSRSFDVTVPPMNGSYLNISAFDIERSTFVSLLGSLYETDVDTWLAALPERTVKPLERPEVVDEMLEGIPRPEGLDVEELRGEPAALSRYQLGTKVTGAVACLWLDQWAAAVASGDTTAAEEAVDAMATARQWPILRELASEGGWSQVIWDYSDEMKADDRKALLGSAGTETGPDGSVYELSPSYATGLGCDSEHRTLIEKRNRPPRAANFNSKPVSDAFVKRAVATSGG